jgi:hypothetical protein
MDERRTTKRSGADNRSRDAEYEREREIGSEAPLRTHSCYLSAHDRMSKLYTQDEEKARREMRYAGALYL